MTARRNYCLQYIYFYDNIKLNYINQTMKLLTTFLIVYLISA